MEGKSNEIREVKKKEGSGWEKRRKDRQLLIQKDVRKDRGQGGKQPQTQGNEEKVNRKIEEEFI